MRSLDLFSGIGGFALAAHWTGEIETVGFCEIEPFPRKVLKKNFPGIPIAKDVKQLKGTEYGPIELICGGYPCQPFSHAGQRKGENDDRHLWPEVFRIIKNTRPRWCLFENVGGHINMGLDQVLADLESEFYTAEAIVIPACAVNAPHRRDRVWIIAHANRQGQSNGPNFTKTPRELAKQINTNTGRTFIKKYTQSKLLAEKNQGRPAKVFRHGYTRRTWDAFPIEPPVCGRDDGVSKGMDRPRGHRSHSIKAYGNAIVPQVAYQILKIILKADKEFNK